VLVNRRHDRPDGDRGEPRARRERRLFTATAVFFDLALTIAFLLWLAHRWRVAA